MLEMAKEEVEVSADQLGWIIGKKGANIKELMAETKVSRCEILKGEPPAMLLMGSREAVEEAKLWLQCHTDYLDEMEQQEDEIGQLRRELDTTSLSGRGKGGKGKGGKGGYQGGYQGGRGYGGKGEDRQERNEAPKPKPIKSEGGKGSKNGGKGNEAPKPKPAPKAKEPKAKDSKAKDEAPKPKPAPKPKGNESPKPKPKADATPKPKPAAVPAPKPLEPTDAAPKPKRNRAKKGPGPTDV